MLVYAEHITPRLRYIAGFLLGDLLGLKPGFTSDREEASKAEGPVIAYSADPPGEVFHIVPAGLLSGRGIQPFIPGIRKSGKEVFLFPSDKGSLWFDIFSASFYLLSRYEEYLPFNADEHGRFPATESLACKEGFLEVPVVNRWAAMLGAELKKMYPGLVISRPGAAFRTTIDIDIAWSVKNKGVYRTVGGMTRQLLLGNTGNIAERMNILRRKAPDPFDTYEYILANHDESLTLFMLAGPGGKFDLNTPVSHPSWMQLVKDLSLKFNIGFHPSYNTSGQLSMYRSEKQLLEDITGKPLTRIRQHFLRMTFPATYRRSAEEGFTEDYSMGFADRPGFRAGTSSPFLFYDLEKDAVSTLKVFPFTVMDRTLKDYLKLSPQEAKAKVRSLVETIKQEGGCFIPIWHNDSLGDSGEWKGWKDIYTDLLAMKNDLF